MLYVTVWSHNFSQWGGGGSLDWLCTTVFAVFCSWDLCLGGSSEPAMTWEKKKVGAHHCDPTTFSLRHRPHTCSVAARWMKTHTHTEQCR